MPYTWLDLTPAVSVRPHRKRPGDDARTIGMTSGMDDGQSVGV